jgi:hypothetical protein
MPSRDGLRQAKPASARAAIADLRRVPSLLLGQIRRVFSLVAPRGARNCAISLGPANRSALQAQPVLSGAAACRTSEYVTSEYVTGTKAPDCAPGDEGGTTAQTLSDDGMAEIVVC